MATVLVLWLLALVRLPVLPNNLVLLCVTGTALVVSRDHAVAVRTVLRAGAAAYLFAAFAKYNSTFLDPGVSCAPVILDRLVGSWGLSAPPRWLVNASPIPALLTESAVGIGLLVPRLRRHAALLGVAFHGLLAYDLGQHFWDFTTALLPIFVVASSAVALALTAHARRLIPALVAHVALALLAGVAVLTGLPIRGGWFLLAGHLFWLVGGTLLVLGWGAVHLIQRPWRATPTPQPVGWTTGAMLLVGLVVLNGLAPYAQVKTGYSWNMYSNLRVVGDATNHLVVPAFDLRGDHDELLTVVSASDASIEAYTDRGLQLPRVQLEDWVARTPGSRVVARTGAGETVVLTSGESGGSAPSWVVRLLPLRPVGDDCLLFYGPAG